MNTLMTLMTGASLVAACSTIGTVNGVPVNQPTSLSTQNTPSYCAARPAICILGVALGLGAPGYLVNQSDDNGPGDPA